MCPTCKGEPIYREGTVGPQTVGMEPRGRVHVCPTCHAKLKPCSVEGCECQDYAEHTFTENDLKRMHEIVGKRKPLREEPIPLDDA